MFTGIIEEIGRVRKIVRQSRSAQIEIEARKILADIKQGDSIAVNGVCLTVVSFGAQFFVADVMPETISKTNLQKLHPGSPVNLERAVQLGGRLGGHLVQGHVDAVGTMVERETLEIAIIYRIRAEQDLMKFLVPKGSIAVDGVSLTVVDVFTDSFTVSLIPLTAHETILGQKGTGDTVNLESDIIGRYVHHLMHTDTREKRRDISASFLAEHGFV